MPEERLAHLHPGKATHIPESATRVMWVDLRTMSAGYEESNGRPHNNGQEENNTTNLARNLSL